MATVALIPVCGMGATRGHHSLVVDLCDSGEWRACRREFRRLELQGTTPSSEERLADAVAAVRLGDATEATERLFALESESQAVNIAAEAALERAGLLWRTGTAQNALDAALKGFVLATRRDLFLRSACTAFLIMKQRPEFRKRYAPLALQVDATRALWTGAILASCRSEPPRAGLAARFADWIVRTYRRQVAPAIGQRCVLAPSCSAYFLQAAHHHGLLGFPMIADRLFREPSLSNARRDPVRVNGKVRYRDPVDRHTFWMQP